MLQNCDVLILGAGMAGASLAAELAPFCSVRLLEIEDVPGRHATGRSAAVLFESYGNATVRGLTRASRSFLAQPPEGFAEAPLMRARSALFVADASRCGQLDLKLALPDAAPSLRAVDAADALRLCPILRPEWVAGGVLDESGQDLDVAAIHHGYLKLARKAGVSSAFGAEEVDIVRRGGLWCTRSRAGTFSAPILVNATGAWADVVGRLAAVPPIGLQPMRRSVVMLPGPPGYDIHDWPMVADVGEEFYFKPDAGQLLLSPANEDPMDPCDVAPDEIDIAIAVDRFEKATTVDVKRVNHCWAGLRSFVADRSPVAGFDDQSEGFFWLAGQGGYGIQIAPALARAAATLVMGLPLPEDIRAQGVTEAALAPSRLRPQNHLA